MRKELPVLDNLPPVVQDPFAADSRQEGLRDPLEVLEPRRLPLDLVVEAGVVAGDQQDADHLRLKFERNTAAAKISMFWSLNFRATLPNGFSRQTVTDTLVAR